MQSGAGAADGLMGAGDGVRSLRAPAAISVASVTSARPSAVNACSTAPSSTGSAASAC